MTGNERRKAILEMLRNAEGPISGTQIGKKTGVSRQVVVQDIALLRTQGNPISSTHYGYILEKPKEQTMLVKVCHTEEQTEDELNSIVDLGGTVVDVIINHRTYGKMSAPLNVKCRKDVERFLDQIASGKSSPLSRITSGYHFHHISADSEETLDEIEKMLADKGYLVDFMPYEVGTI
ncbi:MAG: transcription repressor NadR [Coriobacteriales bacterium]